MRSRFVPFYLIRVSLQLAVMASEVEAREGFCPFSTTITPRSCRLWYRIVGNLTADAPPIVVLHGGPGMTHDYLLAVEDLAQEPYNLALIFWDQLGCGKSTLLPETAGEEGAWSETVFSDQLDCLLRYLKIDGSYSILGHSWGGMLAAAHAAQQPDGLRKLVLASTPFSMLHYTGAYCRYREKMPQHHREVLERPRGSDAVDTPEYLEAMGAFNKRHFLNLDHVPDEVQRSYDFVKQDSTVWMSA